MIEDIKRTYKTIIITYTKNMQLDKSYRKDQRRKLSGGMTTEQYWKIHFLVHKVLTPE